MLIDLNDNQLNESFAKNYFDQCFSQVVSLVREKQLFKENQKLILSIARQLATSFLTTQFNCQIIGRQLIHAIVDQSYEVREMAVSLVGDVISEIGSTVIEKSNKQETNELKEIRKALNEIRVTGIAEEKSVKVFIPEKAIAYAMKQLTPEIYHKIVLNIFIIKCDQTSNLRHQAVNMWKLITVKPLATMRGFLPYLTPTLVGLLRKYYENKY